MKPDPLRDALWGVASLFMGCVWLAIATGDIALALSVGFFGTALAFLMRSAS